MCMKIWLPIILLVFMISFLVATTAPRECILIKNDDFSTCNKMFKHLNKFIGSTPNRTCEKLEKSINQTDRNKGNSSKAKNKLSPSKNPFTCEYNEVCNKTFRKLTINLHPFSLYINKHIIDEMINQCCGTCAQTCIVDTLQDISKLNLTILNQSDIVFPVFAMTKTKKLYGYWYIPIVDLPYAFYVTKALSNEEIMNNLLLDFRSLWPLLVICIVFAITAGFLIWLLDTRSNREEFPREFLIGWFEGFWWSFISMTTVGYGDKAPKSRFARLFSICWILIGITIFSMLTASFSNIMTNAEKPKSTNMAGKTVGALQYRIYDATVIGKHGGRIHVVPHDNLTHGIDKLRDLLFSEDKKIDGFLIDKHAYLYYCKDTEQCNRLSKTVRSVKQLDYNKYSYGALLREEIDYHYFRMYMKYNWYHFDTCMDLAINEQSKHLKKEKKFVLLSAHSGLFIPTLIAVAVMIGVFCFSGALIELIRRNNKTRTRKVKTNI